MEKISIIVPCYNGEKFISRCVESLVRQTIGLEALEIVLVNDASTDSTYDILCDWERKYPDNILVINNSENMRQGGARNLGMAYSSGEYIGFLDQDDWVEASMYEKLYHAISEYDCEVASVLLQREYEDGVEVNMDDKKFICSKKVTINTVKDRKKFLEVGLPGLVCTKLYRRSFLQKHKISFPEHLVYEDNYFSGLVYYCLKSYVILKEKLYHYIINPDSTTIGVGNRHFDRLEIEKLKIEEYKRRGFFDDYHDEIELEFLQLYWCNTLGQFFLKLPEVPYQTLEEMAQTIQKYFPDYKSNPYLYQLSESDQALIKLIDLHLSQEEWDLFVSAFRGRRVL